MNGETAASWSAVQFTDRPPGFDRVNSARLAVAPKSIDPEDADSSPGGASVVELVGGAVLVGGAMLAGGAVPVGTVPVGTVAVGTVAVRTVPVGTALGGLVPGGLVPVGLVPV
ncbi:MAG: hypothetical protein ACO3D0_13095, partial [Ilumatobacteraceae bacterium]